MRGMKKNKLTLEQLMEKIEEKKKQKKNVTISSFLNILEDEETFILFENGPLTTGKYNGGIFVRLQDEYQLFFYKKEEVHMKDKKGEDHISYPNCIGINEKISKDHIKILEEFEQKLEDKKELLEKRNEKYKKIRQDHQLKHLLVEKKA
jgi:hypothetical protein